MDRTEIWYLKNNLLSQSFPPVKIDHFSLVTKIGIIQNFCYIDIMFEPKQFFLKMPYSYAFSIKVLSKYQFHHSCSSFLINQDRFLKGVGGGLRIQKSFTQLSLKPRKKHTKITGILLANSSIFPPPLHLFVKPFFNSYGKKRLRIHALKFQKSPYKKIMIGYNYIIINIYLL